MFWKRMRITRTSDFHFSHTASTPRARPTFPAFSNISLRQNLYRSSDRSAVGRIVCEHITLIQIAVACHSQIGNTSRANVISRSYG
ncbi:MAG: hypothetical protein WBF43_10610, partial [Methylocella sp.]